MAEELPLIVFITSAQCGHCVAFRGNDGKPNSSRMWNYDYIRSLLNIYPSKRHPEMRRRASAIVEIHVSTFGNDVDNISEINIYTSIPSIAEITALTKSGRIGSLKFFDTNDIVGNSIERINIKRGVFDSVEVRVEVDGVYSRHMTESAVNDYVWGQSPEEIQLIRECIKEGIKVPKEIFAEIPDENLRKFVSSYYSQYKNDIKLFDQQLLTHHFNFHWVTSKIFVKDIRRYETHYPCWMIVSPSEWRKSLNDRRRPIYARVRNHMTQKTANGYTTIPFSDSETVEILLDKHENGSIKLEYDPTRNIARSFSWQKR